MPFILCLAVDMLYLAYRVDWGVCASSTFPLSRYPRAIKPRSSTEGTPSPK